MSLIAATTSGFADCFTNCPDLLLKTPRYFFGFADDVSQLTFRDLDLFWLRPTWVDVAISFSFDFFHKMIGINFSLVVN